MSTRYTKYYRAKDGVTDFLFEFVGDGSRFEIYCREHPSLDGRDPDPHKTHLFGSGRLCFHAGREPDSPRRAEQLAAQWAEYFLKYRRTGVTQS